MLLQPITSLVRKQEMFDNAYTLQRLKCYTVTRPYLIRMSHGFQMVFRYVMLTNEALLLLYKALNVISAAKSVSF